MCNCCTSQEGSVSYCYSAGSCLKRSLLINGPSVQARGISRAPRTPAFKSPGPLPPSDSPRSCLPVPPSSPAPVHTLHGSGDGLSEVGCVCGGGHGQLAPARTMHFLAAASPIPEPPPVMVALCMRPKKLCGVKQRSMASCSCDPSTFAKKIYIYKKKSLGKVNLHGRTRRNRFPTRCGPTSATLGHD
jgi:hypothetical protein